uniref:Cytochrome P450 CYP71C36 n=1 Tax=Zea mays TaxID=4577 RepID=B6UA52_MAIZE|nr:cytochrome P450 CYP71C36 [Zea mays]
MENLAGQQFVYEVTSLRALFLLLLLPPFIFLIMRNARATTLMFDTKRTRGHRQPADRQQSLPPSPPAVPVLGHLHLVGSLPHVSLRSLARTLGADLMLLRLGSTPVLVVSSSSAAEAVLRTHDHVFASRPHALVSEVVLYGPSDVGFAPHGDCWRRGRKLITTHLLSVNRVQSFRHAREEEVSVVMGRIAEAAAAGAAVDVGELLGSFTNDLACRAVMGKSFRSEGRNKLFRELVLDTTKLLVGFNVEDFFPFLARFGVLSKLVRAKSERLRRRWDELLDRLIEDRESKYEAAAASDLKVKDDDDDNFIHVLLSVQQEYGHITREQMKALLQDVFIGGIDSTSSLLEFTMAELMRKPRVMNKLQAEVRSSTPEGHDGVVGEDSLEHMAYLRAVTKESLRIHNVTPLLAPHLSMDSCTIDGYTVPAGVQVLINSWAIGRDTRYWGDDAEEFVPERFMDGGSAVHVSFKGSDFEFLPFGSGRRMCAGVNFAMATVELMLANLVHRFDWDLPPGQEGRDIDVSQVFGLVVRRKKKLLLVPKLRVY